MTVAVQSARLGDIPLIWVAPDDGGARPLVIWLHAFSWTKEDMIPQLADLAARGCMALSWDLPAHGERAGETPEEIRLRVRSDLRRHFWPILAQGASEVPTVIDWAVRNLGVKPEVGVGGVSMGGDIAVVAAGLDRRVDRVAAVLATPDWLRPGSTEWQGAAGAEQQDLYRRFDPLTNATAYHAHCPAMLFVCGAQDRQVPSEGAEIFIEKLGDAYACDRSRLAIVHQAGVAHRFTPWMWEQALAWLEAAEISGAVPLP